MDCGMVRISHCYVILTMNWQQIAVAIVGITVAAIVIRSILRQVRRKSCDCGCCSDKECPGRRS